LRGGHLGHHTLHPGLIGHHGGLHHNIINGSRIHRRLFIFTYIFFRCKSHRWIIVEGDHSLTIIRQIHGIHLGGSHLIVPYFFFDADRRNYLVFVILRFVFFVAFLASSSFCCRCLGLYIFLWSLHRSGPPTLKFFLTVALYQNTQS